MFLSGIWLVKKRHNEDTSWLDEMRDKMGSVEKQDP